MSHDDNDIQRLDQTKIEELETMQYAINTSFYKKGASAANQGSVRKRTKKVQYEN